MDSRSGSISFSFYSDDELERISSIEIMSEDDIHSSLLGTGTKVFCSTCQVPRSCLGHMGFIRLGSPIFNPLCIREIIQAADMTCFQCGAFATIIKMKGRKVCKICQSPSRSYSFDSKRMCLISKREPSYSLTPELVKRAFSELPHNNQQEMNDSLKHPETFIMNLIPVIPNCARLSSEPDDLLARSYATILRHYNEPAIVYKEYCTVVGKDSLVDNEESLTNRISGKDGTFRKYSLGKRNKHCARAVITPDPNLDVDELGIPLAFAEKVKVVNNGDYVLVNRQPSLQRMSLMAFRARILPDSYVIRINPFVCPAFNADFDGDEMNIFCASTFYSKAECRELLSIDKCILSPQNSLPTIYPIQDCVVGAFLMYGNEEVVDSLSLQAYVSSADAVSNLSPKSLIREFIRLSLRDNTFDVDSMTSKVLRTVVKRLYIEQGGRSTSMFMKTLQTMVDDWLLGYGLSVGYDDLIINHISLPTPVIGDNEHETSIILNNARNVSQRVIEEHISHDNPLFAMIKSGAKGSSTNLGQMTSLVGQQWVRGSRPECVLPDGRALSWCRPGDNAPSSRGFVSSCYSKGLSPSEYFFHCQGGREGLVNTGVNTSSAGYIHRRLSKSMQDVIVHYDGTIRDDNNIIQFCYGKDNSDPSKI